MKAAAFDKKDLAHPNCILLALYQAQPYSKCGHVHFRPGISLGVSLSSRVGDWMRDCFTFALGFVCDDVTQD